VGIQVGGGPFGGAAGARQRGRKVHRHHAIPAAVGQCLLVGVGEFGRRRGRRGGVTLVDVFGDLVHTVAQVHPVEQDVQRHNAYCPLLQQVGRQARRRVGHHDDSHERGLSVDTPV
jgi:hypothetical protein